MTNTSDLSEFGFRELEEGGKLLLAYCKNPQVLGDKVKLELNKNSGYVFLVDEDYNFGMMNGDKLEKWFICPECGHEGFLEDMKHGEDNDECLEYLEQIGALSQEEKVLRRL